jgi:hypothetical protein
VLSALWDVAAAAVVASPVVILVAAAAFALVIQPWHPLVLGAHQQRLVAVPRLQLQVQLQGLCATLALVCILVVVVVVVVVAGVVRALRCRFGNSSLKTWKCQQVAIAYIVSRTGSHKHRHSNHRCRKSDHSDQMEIQMPMLLELSLEEARVQRRSEPEL